MKMCCAYRLIFMQIKVIFIWKVLHRVVLKQRHEITWKWPIYFTVNNPLLLYDQLTTFLHDQYM